MYLHKKLYLALRIISGIGTWLWGILTGLLVFGILMDLIAGSRDFVQAGIPSALVGIGSLWGVHWIIKYWTERLKIYDGILSNDPDGFLPARVAARALGLAEKTVIADIRFLCKFHLLRNCSLEQRDAGMMIVLSQNAKAQEQTKTVICPHCGAKNLVRAGFVSGCSFCAGSLSGGGNHHVPK